MRTISLTRMSFDDRIVSAVEHVPHLAGNAAQQFLGEYQHLAAVREGTQKQERVVELDEGRCIAKFETVE